MWHAIESNINSNQSSTIKNEVWKFKCPLLVYFSTIPTSPARLSFTKPGVVLSRFRAPCANVENSIIHTGSALLQKSYPKQELFFWPRSMLSWRAHQWGISRHWLSEYKPLLATKAPPSGSGNRWQDVSSLSPHSTTSLPPPHIISQKNKAALAYLSCDFFFFFLLSIHFRYPLKYFWAAIFSVGRWSLIILTTVFCQIHFTFYTVYVYLGRVSAF